MYKNIENIPRKELNNLQRKIKTNKIYENTYNSITIYILNAFSQEDIERYKLYPTENINIHLKLDTQMGYVYMVQRRSSDVESMTIQVNKYRPDVYRDDDSLGSTIVIGRYELYPTENIWTFLM